MEAYTYVFAREEKREGREGGNGKSGEAVCEPHGYREAMRLRSHDDDDDVDEDDDEDDDDDRAPPA